MYNAIASTGVTGGVALGTEEVWNAKQLLKRLATILADGKRRPMPYALARMNINEGLVARLQGGSIVKWLQGFHSGYFTVEFLAQPEDKGGTEGSGATAGAGATAVPSDDESFATVALTDRGAARYLGAERNAFMPRETVTPKQLPSDVMQEMTRGFATAALGAEAAGVALPDSAPAPDADSAAVAVSPLASPEPASVPAPGAEDEAEPAVLIHEGRQYALS